jgi:hypothetical protein
MIPGGKGVYLLDDKYRPFAFVGVGFILGLVCALLILKHSREFIIDAIVGTAEPTPIVTRSNTLTPMPTPAVLRSELVAILTYHETYFTAMDDQTGWNWELKSEEDKIQNWERFTLLYLDNGKVALKTYHGRFVTATGDDGCCNWTLRAETLDRGVSEEFSLVDAGDGKVAFETHQGRYVSAPSAGQCWRVRAETTHLDDWEKFTLISLE